MFHTILQFNAEISQQKIASLCGLKEQKIYCAYMLQNSYESASREVMRDIFNRIDMLVDSAEIKDNVVSVNIPEKGTFVINRQPPKKEIWLSSPVSGPYHFRYKDKKWIDNQGNSLFKIVSEEILNRQYSLE